jgi:hypothetical protein
MIKLFFQFWLHFFTIRHIFGLLDCDCTLLLEKDVNQIKDCEGSKHSQRNHKRVLNVRFCHKKLKIFSFSIWDHGNHGTLLFFNTHECQENQIKNPFDLILGFGLVKDFWNKNILSLKNDIFTKDF